LTDLRYGLRWGGPMQVSASEAHDGRGRTQRHSPRCYAKPTGRRGEVQARCQNPPVGS
jgi:hypothetical protein